MTTYHFDEVIVWVGLAGDVRGASGVRSISVIDPSTGLAPTTLTQGGVTVGYLTAGVNGRATFTATSDVVVHDFGAGPVAAYSTERLSAAAGGVGLATVDAAIAAQHTADNSAYDATGAAAAAQAAAIQRANHTGTQAVGTITGLGDAAVKNTGTTAGTLAAGDDSRLAAATATTSGIVELATTTEAVTGTDTVRAVTPAGVAAAVAVGAGAPSTATLLFSPSGNLDTPSSGTATWLTLGNVTVPSWATHADVVYTINGIYEITAAVNVSIVMKIGAVAGAVSKRFSTTGYVAATRTNLPVMDTFTGLASGVQSVTISATWAGGTGANRADVSSWATALFIFRP